MGTGGGGGSVPPPPDPPLQPVTASSVEATNDISLLERIIFPVDSAW
jgi:hypothetical protein